MNAAQPASPPPLTMAVLSRDEILKAIEKRCASHNLKLRATSPHLVLLLPPRLPLAGRIGSDPRCNPVTALSLLSRPPFPVGEALAPPSLISLLLNRGAAFYGQLFMSTFFTLVTR